MRITFISDTHTKHRNLTLPGGDLLIHAGDLMNSGRVIEEVADFTNWFSNQLQYKHKVFIAGNHDRLFEDVPESVASVIKAFGRGITYLEDQSHIIDAIKLYGSPWQPEFYNWAFNLPRNGHKLEEKWSMIPSDTDILITHGPPQGHLDVSGYGDKDLGCELLRIYVDNVKPKIHVFGHIHGSYGYKFDGQTHFINAAVLDERYYNTNHPITADWNPETNELNIID